MKFPYLLLSLFCFITILVSSCSFETEQERREKDKTVVILGKSKSSEPVAYSSAISHWIGSYTFTDSPLTSEERVYMKDTIISSDFSASRMQLSPCMELNITVEDSKLIGNLKLKYVEYPRDVDVFIRGNAKEIGVYYLSENSNDKSFEEKGELLFILTLSGKKLNTTWKSWYPRGKNLIVSGFIKNAF